MDGAREKPLEWTRAALDQLDEQIEYRVERTRLLILAVMHQRQAV